MPAHDPTPLILFSGLGADENLFKLQKLAFPQLIVPDWPVPSSGETLDAYGKRLADDLRSHGPAIIGGASFGGIVALHVARYLDPLAVLLIGSVRDPKELPLYARSARPLRWLVRFIPIRMLQFCTRPVASQVTRRWFPHISGLAKQFRGSDPRVFKWSLSRILDWDTTPSVSCLVFQIHGDRDFVLPCRQPKPDALVVGGGHLISLTHASEVNDFIRWVLIQCGDEPSCGRDEDGASASSPAASASSPAARTTTFNKCSTQRLPDHEQPND